MPNCYFYYGSKARYPSSTLFPSYIGVSLLELNRREKGTLIIKGLLENLGKKRLQPTGE